MHDECWRYSAHVPQRRVGDAAVECTSAAADCMMALWGSVTGRARHQLHDSRITCMQRSDMHAHAMHIAPSPTPSNHAWRVPCMPARQVYNLQSST
jgi:hypothetical protein